MSLKSIIARGVTRKAAGISQHYPEHAGKSGVKIERSKPVTRSLCMYEGAVIEACMGCNGESKSVRQCFHPQADRDRCTRDYVSDKVQACSQCEDYEAA